MARPTYTPTPEERERVRKWIEVNSGYGHNGVRLPGTHLYPRGITSFAQEVQLTRVTVSRALNGHVVTKKAWHKIMGEVLAWDTDALVRMAARITGDPPGIIRERLRLDRHKSSNSRILTSKKVGPSSR